jgi:hypothetical protein
MIALSLKPVDVLSISWSVMLESIGSYGGSGLVIGFTGTTTEEFPNPAEL